MLPSPATLTRRGAYRPYAHRKRGVIDILSSRTRITNLAALLLISLTVISLFLNVRSWYEAQRVGSSSASTLFSTISRSPTVRRLHHLIIIPGHAIWKGADPELRLREDQWVLESYQKGGNRISAFSAHIFRGVELVTEDENALLVFSGGQTRSESTMTEAESYLRLALAAQLFHPNSLPFIRATTEDHALDSFQNLLFSIARFHEYTGRYPRYITIVGYEFKQARFTDLHRAAIRWPLSSFKYIGIDPEADNTNLVEEGEKNNAYTPYSKDPYGCHSTLLSKRRERNRYNRFHSYYYSCPELRDLLDWCPKSNQNNSALFMGYLPWDHV